MKIIKNNNFSKKNIKKKKEKLKQITKQWRYIYNSIPLIALGDAAEQDST